MFGHHLSKSLAFGTKIFYWTKICGAKIGQEAGPCNEDSVLKKHRTEEKYTVFH